MGSICCLWNSDNISLIKGDYSYSNENGLVAFTSNSNVNIVDIEDLISNTKDKSLKDTFKKDIKNLNYYLNTSEYYDNHNVVFPRIQQVQKNIFKIEEDNSTRLFSSQPKKYKSIRNCTGCIETQCPPQGTDLFKPLELDALEKLLMVPVHSN